MLESWAIGECFRGVDFIACYVLPLFSAHCRRSRIRVTRWKALKFPPPFAESFFD
jgi:hypothetical protein